MNPQRTVKAVVLADLDGALRSRVVASRAGLVTTEAVEKGDFDEGRAVKVVCPSEVSAGDWVVRVVKAGNRRFVETLVGNVPAAVEAELNRLPQRGEGDDATWQDGSEIKLESGSFVNVTA